LSRRRRRAVPASEPSRPAFDPVHHTVAHDGRTAGLTPTEYRLLATLVGQRGAVVRRADLIAVAWPATPVVRDNTLDVFAVRLRHKLREIGAAEGLESVRGVGYAFR
jgi:two-component system, OmpR family, response regulator